MSTHNIYFRGEIRKIICGYPLLSVAMDKRGSHINEPPHDKTNKMASATSEYSDQPGHQPSLTRVFAVHSMGSKGPKLSSCRQRRL